MIFKTEPRKHQLVQFNKHKDAPFFALFDDMGTGKSKIAIDICAYNFTQGKIDACLIIAPNNVHIQWIKEQFPKHCPIAYQSMIWDNSNSKYYTNALINFALTPKKGILKVFAVNVEAFQAEKIIEYIAYYVKNNKCFIILDESTKIKNYKAKRSKVIHRLNKYGIRCILTGTPAVQSPFNLWSQFEFLKENYFGCNYFIFQHRYGLMMMPTNPQTGKKYIIKIDEKTFNMAKSKLAKIKEMRGGELMPDDYHEVSVIMGISEQDVRYIEMNDAFVQYKRLDELKAIIEKDSSSIRIDDCLDLPEKIYEVLPVEMSEEQKKIYNNLKQELLATYSGKELTVTNKISLTQRLMQVTGGFFPYSEQVEKIDGTEHLYVNQTNYKMIGEKNVKLEALKEEIEDLPENEPFIIWATYVAELQLMYNELKKDYKCALYYGAISQEKRTQIIKDFQEGKIRGFIANQATAAFGLNFQHCTYQFYFSNSFKIEDRIQAEGRSHRDGVKKSVVYKDIVMQNSLDEKICEAIKSGKDMNDFFTSMPLEEILR